jgi:probable F420-dependent oxidoreductase
MHVGLFAVSASPFATPEYLHTLATAGEERGFHSLWVPEHVVLFDEYKSKYPYSADGRIPASSESGPLDPFAVLSFLGGITRTIRLGTGICLVPQRNPVYTAKDVASVDWLSNGRLDFGVGIGWLAEEFRALGVPFERRGARCRAYLEVMRRCWCDPISQYEGEFYSLPPCRQYPKPVQQPHPPIYFGGESDAALARVADLGQGWFPFSIGPDVLGARMRDLEHLLAARGRRDRPRHAELQVAICPYMSTADLDLVKRYRDAGADQVVLLVMASLQNLRPVLDEMAKAILEPARRLS